MKTTIEISDAIFRQAKARASLHGQTLKSFFHEAILDKLEKERRSGEQDAGWQKVFGKAPSPAVKEVQRAIDREFSRVDPGEWK